MKDIRQVPGDRRGRLCAGAGDDTDVQFVRVLPYGRERVWRAIIDPAWLADWFPGFQLEPRRGGAFQIWFGGVHDGPADVSGTVAAFDPPQRLQCGTMRWLVEIDPRGSQLTFTDTLPFGRTHHSDYELTNSVLAGWHFYLDSLESSLAGTLDPNDTLEYDYARIEVPGRAPVSAR